MGYLYKQHVVMNFKMELRFRKIIADSARELIKQATINPKLRWSGLLRSATIAALFGVQRFVSDNGEKRS
ncbi:hypothetical protein CWE13_04005 [Aliidiomarina shirensis]|uniref:Uncharacterized protein n=1 Tax=Aliidiomarina shirensis TaxID=1048642 RepID=A0A432WYG1_9GAMM|nr:hypothetical protein CWE13_04005 [Aliidiomarina shirensis]